MGRIQPILTDIGVIIHVLSTMDIPVWHVSSSKILHQPLEYVVRDIVMLRKAGDAPGHKPVVVFFACVFVFSSSISISICICLCCCRRCRRCCCSSFFSVYYYSCCCCWFFFGGGLRYPVWARAKTPLQNVRLWRARARTHALP